MPLGNAFQPSGSDDDDLRALLRAEDPARDLPPVTPTQMAELVEGTIAPDEVAIARSRRSRRARLSIAGGTAAGAVAVAAAVVLGTSGPAGVAAVTELAAPAGAQAPGAPTAMCAEVTPDALRQLSTAFEARVTAADDDTATFTVTERFKGVVQDTATAPQQVSGLPSELSVGRFETGRTYLIGTTDGKQIAACGRSGASSPALKSLYDEAFGR